MISVEIENETTFRVTVAAEFTTTHLVAVQTDYAESLTKGNTNTNTTRLIEASFEFLLEREPNTSILRQFDLPLISRYFPEYESVIRDRL
ncbi:MAG: hypothetical protein ACI9OD_002303 [Limisphaerales bacterium]|jgi:hypothetical protein